MNTRRPEPPRKLSEAANACFGWLCNQLGSNTTEQWLPIDGTTLACLAELLESQEQIQDALQAEPQNATYLRLRLQFAAQIATYSRMLGLCPKHRQEQQQLTSHDLDAIAAELGVDPSVLASH